MSRLNMARKIRENHQNLINNKDNDYYHQQTKDKNNDNQYIMAKMGDVYGQKGNYHLNEYNIEYLGDLRLDKNNQKNNNFRIRNIRHNNSKIRKGNDLLNINYLKDLFKENNNDRRRGKSSYKPNNSNINNNGDINKDNNNIKYSEKNVKQINETQNDEDNNKTASKTDNLYYTYDNNNNNNFPTNITNYFMSCKFLFTMSVDEIEEYLNLLWKQLGVKDNYIRIFNSQKNNFSNLEEKIDFLILEIENLKKFEDILIKLSNEIESREKNIELVKNICEIMNKNENENDENDNKKINNDFFNSIISYRVHSIKVVEYYLLFKEKIIQGNIKDKFDEEYIKKKYGLIKKGCNYLIKMKNDMSFLCNTKIYNNKENKDIFNSFKGDPFLCSLYNVIPLSREYKQRIKYCQYYIIQEMLNENALKDINNNNKSIPINNNLNDIKDYRNYKKKKLEPIVNHSNYKEKSQIIANNTNQTCTNQNKDYNPNESGYSKKYNKSVINSNKNNLNTYDDNKNNSEISQNNKKIKIENKNNSNFDYKDDNINDDMVNIQNTDNNNIYANKINIKNIEINNNTKEDYEDINKNININYEKEKQNNNINIKNKKEENILQNSLTISKKMKKKKEASRSATPESKKLTNITPSNNNENINNVNTSIILDNNKNNLKNYNSSYYCGSLSDFITIYNNYYKRIPIEQKRIFNIKENPMSYFQHNYFPKIIICSDTKLTLIKGICVFSYIFNNSENKSNKIIIEHLSSYNKDEMENILNNIFDFLKNNNFLNNINNNNIQNEIYIDLYFHLENEKFVIDTNIRDYIKNLKFKWVKLENISKEIRYQKMKHQFTNNNKDLLNNEIDDNNILNQSILGLKALKNKNEEAENNSSDNDSENNSFKDNSNKDDNSNDNNLLCNFYIKNKSIIKYINQNDIKNKLEANNNKLIFNNIKYINPFNFIYLIKKISEDSIYSEYILNNTYNFFKMNDHIDISEILNSNDGVSLNDILANTSFISSDIQQLINFFNNQNNDNNIKDKKTFDIKTKINIMPLFDNCISIKYKKYYYNRIENDNIKILIEKETKQKFYFISPNNNQSNNIILLISSSLNEEFKNKYICPQNNSNISLKFIDIYNNITSIETNPNEKNNKKYLYIPSFYINSKIKNFYKKHNKPEADEDIGENNETYIINEYDEYFNIKFISEDFIGESMKSKNIKNKIKNSYTNFYFDKIEDDYINNKDCIIDDNFILFILNFDIIDNFAAIPLMSLYITKDNFISEI